MKDEEKYWKVKTNPLRVRTYDEAKKQAVEIFSEMKGKSKRKIHVKSKYFKKQKVFFDYFWDHLIQKPIPSRKKRLKLLPGALELIANSTYIPYKNTNPNKKSEMFYRFEGMTPGGELFAVQIKSTGSGSLQCMSVFPRKTKKPR